MTTYKPYLHLDNSIVVGVVDEDKKLIGFTVCDRNVERFSKEMFESAALAISWSNNYFSKTGSCEICGKVADTRLYGKWWCDKCRVEVI